MNETPKAGEQVLDTIDVLHIIEEMTNGVMWKNPEADGHVERFAQRLAAAVHPLAPWTERERKVIEELKAATGLSEYRVLLQGLRLYQLVQSGTHKLVELKAALGPLAQPETIAQRLDREKSCTCHMSNPLYWCRQHTKIPEWYLRKQDKAQPDAVRELVRRFDSMADTQETTGFPNSAKLVRQCARLLEAVLSHAAPASSGEAPPPDSEFYEWFGAHLKNEKYPTPKTSAKAAWFASRKAAERQLAELREGLEALSKVGEQAKQLLIDKKFVFKRFPRDLKKKPAKGEEKWEALAFYLYTELWRVGDELRVVLLKKPREGA